MLSKNAGILRTNYPIIDGGDKEESSYKEIFCKYDYGYKAAPDELCGITGVYKGYLQSMEKDT